jgi:formate hydrogenlyase subunit 6/NADH:ubiquinone oxidoreductase subunit I
MIKIKSKKTEKINNEKMNKKWGSMTPLTLGMFIKKADTSLYPAIHANVADRFRGMLAFDSKLCVGCNLCQKVCPTDAIKIEKVENNKNTEKAENVNTGEKRFIAVVQLDKCIFCGQCVDTCRKGALKNTANFELACKNRNDLTVEL